MAARTIASTASTVVAVDDAAEGAEVDVQPEPACGFDRGEDVGAGLVLDERLHREFKPQGHGPPRSPRA
jgi:hypothetical protein